MPISYLELILIEIITMVKDLLVNCGKRKTRSMVNN
jgi:hypothetical protein